MKRSPAKSRRTKADCPHHDRRSSSRQQRTDDWDDRMAPGHLGGQFEDAGYGPGGGFGFRAYHPDRS